MSRLGIFAATFLATLGALSACTQDFNQFTPGETIGLGGSTASGSSTSSSGMASSSSSSSTSSSSSSGSMMCTTDAQCDDNNSCTNDKCATGVCQHLNVADGPDAGHPNVPTECFDHTCKAGVETKVNNDSKIPDDSNPCTVDVCQSGSATHTPEPASKSCGPNQFCDGAGKCVGCNNPAQCPNPPACQVATCMAMTCGTTPAASGTSCGGTKKCDAGGNCVDCLVDADCGGFPQICVANACANSCADATKDGDETDVNCGGACPKCANGKTCANNGDCTSGNCAALVCAPAAPTCSDGIKNGTETDVDCGGGCATKCGNGKACMADGAAGDCQSAHCVGMVCVTACADGVKDGAETDVDCGGGTCGKCALGKACMVNGFNGDCQSNHCVGNVCVTQCADGVKDGAETDVDCGGGACPKCGAGLQCQGNNDCANGTCAGGPPKVCN